MNDEIDVWFEPTFDLERLGLLKAHLPYRCHDGCELFFFFGTWPVADWLVATDA